jgi:hypothetical protein
MTVQGAERMRASIHPNVDPAIQASTSNAGPI